MRSPRSELTFTAVHMTLGIVSIVAAIVATILFVRPEGAAEAPIVVPTEVIEAADKQVVAETSTARPSASVKTAAADVPVTKFVSGKPVEIIISSLNMSVPISEGYYNEVNKSWTLGPSSAYYATVTALANNREGTTFIYGHNTRAVFSKLYNLRGGELVMIRTNTGAVFYYVFTGAHDVKPTDVDVLQEVGAPKLVVQTCSGAWDQNRRLFTFKFVKVRI